MLQLECTWSGIDRFRGEVRSVLGSKAPAGRGRARPGTALTQNTMDARWGNISRVQPFPITKYVRSAFKLLPQSKTSISWFDLRGNVLKNLYRNSKLITRATILPSIAAAVDQRRTWVLILYLIKYISKLDISTLEHSERLQIPRFTNTFVSEA